MHGNIYASNASEDASNDSREIDTIPYVASETAKYTTVKHKKKFNKHKKLKSSAAEETPSANTWDEEMHGEQIVYDVNYEINEHLVPWLMDPVSWEEKYGFY